MRGHDRTPLEHSAELKLLADKSCRDTGGVKLPWLVVEGRDDEHLFEQFEVDQIYQAEGRVNVEGILAGHVHEGAPGSGEFVFLTDCDGEGKSKSALLRNQDRLVVTQCCDIEADLFAIGIVHRALSSKLPDEDAAAYVEAAKTMSLGFSLLRRRAHKVSVPMKMPPKGEVRIDLFDLPLQLRLEWRDVSPDWRTVLEHVKGPLRWSDSQVSLVEEQVLDEPISFDRYGLGKDAINALFFMLVEDRPFPEDDPACDWIKAPRPDFRGFGKWLHTHVDASDIRNWEVGRRITAWQLARGVELIKAES